MAAASATPTPDRLDTTWDNWKFSNELVTAGNDSLRQFADVDAEAQKNLVGGWVLLETEEAETFEKRSHVLGQITGIDVEGKPMVQCYNQSGDKDGKAQAEDSVDVWVLPAIGATVTLGDTKFTVKEMATSINSVLLDPAELPLQKEQATAPPPKEEEGADKPPLKKEEQTKESKDKNHKKKVKKTKNKKPQKKQRKRKSKSGKQTEHAAKTEDNQKKRTRRNLKKELDNGSSSAIESSSEFTVESLLRSFADPRGRSCMLAHMCVSICVCSYVRVHACLFICACPCMLVHICVSMHACSYVCVHACLIICACPYMFDRACFNIYDLSYMLYHICFIMRALSYLHIMCVPDDLFDRSLAAELQKRPGLLHLTEKDAEQDPLPVLFNKRMKGYYKCRSLNRQWSLQCLAKAKSAGIFFVRYKCKKTGRTYDGINVLAHFFTIMYLSLHEPGFSVVFDDKGALKTTAVYIKKIQK